MKKTLLLIAVAALAANMQAQLVDFDKIQSWTGEGENRAALVITNDAGASDPHAYIWGYRWPAGETRTGDDMFKAICANNENLVLLTQITGQYGSTVCGIGYGNADKLLEHIYFNFERAQEFEFINFDYFHANSFFGQDEAPGDNTPAICQAVIDEARTNHTHVIQHPLDHPHYGYPAYDYDCWEIDDDGWDYGWWNSAWYCGYWSYWTASKTDTEWMYSGTGFTGRRLSDGCMDAWSFTMFDDPKVGGMGEGTPPTQNPEMFVYIPPKSQTGIADAEIADADAPEEYFTLTGMRVDRAHLAPGIYIVRKGATATKKHIR